jgi:inner membrane protein
MTKQADIGYERADGYMQGRSHLLVGLAAGVVLDSMTHISGAPLTTAEQVTLPLLASKAVYYFSVGFGALLPDIDNARSTLGRRLGNISKEIQHLAGHRTVFHSLLGLGVGSLLAIGLEQVVTYLLMLRGLTIPASLTSGSHLVFRGILFGCLMHLVADGLTTAGVPLLWPSHKRYGFPPHSHWRFRTGTWPESVIVWTFIMLVIIGVWTSIISI